MDSSDKEDELENISKRSVANGVELNINSRTLGVYEQYLKTSIQNFFSEQKNPSNSTSEDANKHLTLQKKTFHYNNNAATPTSNRLLESSSDTITPISQHSSIENGSTSKKVPTIANASHSVKSLTVIGASCTLLLFAIVLIMLNTKGVLVFSPNMSAASTSIASDNSQIDLNAHSTTVIDTSKQDSVPATAEIPSTLNDAVNRAQSADSITPVSYTDFKEEAQRTVYREDKDAYKKDVNEIGKLE